MSAIKTWSTTAAANNAAAPDGFPENMAPSGVNDAARELMAALATWYRDAQWIDLNDTPTYASATSFTITGDVTAAYHVGRRLKLTDASTLYGFIIASAFSSPNTTVTVALDSGALSGSLSAVAVGALSAVAPSIPLLTPVLLDVREISDGPAAVEFVSPAWFGGLFRILELRFYGLRPTSDESDLNLTYRSSSAYLSTGYSVAGQGSAAGGAPAALVDTTGRILLNGTHNIGNGGGRESATGRATVHHPGSASLVKQALFELTHGTETGALVAVTGAGFNAATAALDGLRLQFTDGGTGGATPGTFQNEGAVELWGYR